MKLNGIVFVVLAVLCFTFGIVIAALPPHVVSAQNFNPAPAITGQNIAANGTTVLKTRSGALHLLTINKKGASSNVITIYDNTAASGTVIATIDSTVQPGTWVYDLQFANGLTVVMGTGTAADITVSFQ